MMFHALPALAGSLSTNALGTYYHAIIGSQGGAGGLEQIMELGRKRAAKKTSE